MEKNIHSRMRNETDVNHIILKILGVRYVE